jgi:hypothetical protein
MVSIVLKHFEISIDVEEMRVLNAAHPPPKHPVASFTLTVKVVLSLHN